MLRGCGHVDMNTLKQKRAPSATPSKNAKACYIMNSRLFLAWASRQFTITSLPFTPREPMCA